MRALVLCAGEGKRLRPLTRDMPKVMLPVGGRPLLDYTIRYLARFGFTEIAINLHYRPEAITGYFGDGSRFGVALHYSLEEALLGTAGAVKRLEAWLGRDHDFLVIYGDLLIDQDLDVLVNFHRSRGALATLLLHRRRGSNSRVRMGEDGRIVGFVERPADPMALEETHPWVNSGVQVLSRGIFAHIPAGQPADLPRDVYARLASRERVFGVPLDGYRCAIDSPARYAEAQAAVAQRRYRFTRIGAGESVSQT